MTHPNLFWARQAVDYVRARVGASNRPADVLRDPNIDNKVRASQLEFFQTDFLMGGTAKEFIKRWAELGRNRGVGNCEVQASLGHAKLELMELRAGGQQPATIRGAISNIHGSQMTASWFHVA